MMSPRQNRGAGKQRAPAVPLDYYELLANRRKSSLFFVFFNGEVTERKYFENVSRTLIDDEETRSRFLRLEYAVGTPQQVVTKALDQVKDRQRENEEDSEDIIWVVFDKDDFGDYSTAVKLAKSKGMKVAFSNECFELWLLLYFQDVNRAMGRGKLSEALRCKWEEISNTTIDNPSKIKRFPYNILYNHGSHENAIARAKELHRKAVESNKDAPCEVNPVTTVHLLIENLKEFFL